DNMNKYLIFKCLEVASGRWRGAIAIQLLSHSILNRPELLFEIDSLKIFIKSLIFFAFSDKNGEHFLKLYSKNNLFVIPQYRSNPF
ncbi:MAG: hypothetical protein ACP5D7_11765, partial [Limnospira sp.]